MTISMGFPLQAHASAQTSLMPKASRTAEAINWGGTYIAADPEHDQACPTDGRIPQPRGGAGNDRREPAEQRQPAAEDGAASPQPERGCEAVGQQQEAAARHGDGSERGGHDDDCWTHGHSVSFT